MLTILFVIAHHKLLAEFCNKNTKYEQSNKYDDWITGGSFIKSTGKVDYKI